MEPENVYTKKRESANSAFPFFSMYKSEVDELSDIKTAAGTDRLTCNITA